MLWVASSELTQFIFADLAFSRPFFFTWFATSMFQFYLVGFLVCKPWQQRCFFPLHTWNHFNHPAPTFAFPRRSLRAVSLEPDDPNSISLLNPTAQSQYGRRASHEQSRPSSQQRVCHHSTPAVSFSVCSIAFCRSLQFLRQQRLAHICLCFGSLRTLLSMSVCNVLQLLRTRFSRPRGAR